jgi:site-specific DNA-cytosine methylase
MLAAPAEMFGSTERKRRLKALGNAVVPQIAEAIGATIMGIEARRGAS